MRIQSLEINASPNELAKAVSSMCKIALMVSKMGREDVNASITCRADSGGVGIDVRTDVVCPMPQFFYGPRVDPMSLASGVP